MKFPQNLGIGDITTLLLYIFCAISGLAIFVFGLGYKSTDQMLFGLTALISIILMIAYLILCNIEDSELGVEID